MFCAAGSRRGRRQAVSEVGVTARRDALPTQLVIISSTDWFVAYFIPPLQSLQPPRN